MLLFIKEAISNAAKNWIFQNISCYCLSKLKEVCAGKKYLFQNISCYCLSNREILFRAKKVFQNISCYCLSGTALRWHDRTLISKHLMLLFICHISLEANMADTISKHLMLLFIHRYQEQSGSREQFQNISCYCLSELHLYFSLLLCNFKTSHVIVYQVHIVDIITIVVFQNISCYCLSVLPYICHHFSIIFQNISCYCLSGSS